MHLVSNIFWVCTIQHGHLDLNKLIQTLGEKYPNAEFLWSTFSPNAGKYGQEKLRIWTTFTQWNKMLTPTKLDSRKYLYSFVLFLFLLFVLKLFQYTDLSNPLLTFFKPTKFWLFFADKVTIGTYNFVPLLVKVILLELELGLSASAARKTQSFVSLFFSSTLQLINDISSDLQK